MLQLYGSPITRAQRTIWMLEELDLPYELIPAGVPTVQDPRPLVEREQLERLNPSLKMICCLLIVTLRKRTYLGHYF